MSDRLLNLMARWASRLWDNTQPREIQRLCALLLQLTLLDLRELLSERFQNRYIIVRAEPPLSWSKERIAAYKLMVAELVRYVPEDLPQTTEIPPAWPEKKEPDPAPHKIQRRRGK